MAVSTRAGKHESILEAAAAAFETKGYLGTSMEEIATAAGVSKQTVYKHFSDKERLFSEIVLATTGRIDDMVRLVTVTLDNTSGLEEDLRRLGSWLIVALMDPKLLQLRRLVIANADRFPGLGTKWYEQGFERVLSTLATSFDALAKRSLLRVDDPMLAASHFVGMLLWIPVNRAMFTGNHSIYTRRALEKYAEAAVHAFLMGYAPR